MSRYYNEVTNDGEKSLDWEQEFDDMRHLSEEIDETLSKEIFEQLDDVFLDLYKGEFNHAPF